MKRQPTLADLVLATPPPPAQFVSPRWHAQAMDWVRMAKRFVLDEEAARYVGRMIHQNPRVIADAQDFAIQPYETMWVEMPALPFHRAVVGDDAYEPEQKNVDTHVGYVFRAGTVRTFARAADGVVGGLPVEYRLHTPMTEAEEVALAVALGVSRIGLDLWFWGASARTYLGAMCVNAEDDAHAWDRAGMRALRSNHSARLAPRVSNEPPDYSTIYTGAAGDLRNVVALLLFLNRTANITLATDVPHGEGFVKAKLRPLLSHRVIKLKLDPLPRLLRLSAGLGVKRRLHDVRGHFCHDKIARELGCPHGEEHEGDFGDWWQEYEPLRWRCTWCHGKRWWRHEHKRGDAKTGATVAEYEVTK